MAKKKEVPVGTLEAASAGEALKRELSALPKDVLSIVKTADQLINLDVQCVPSGFPGLDKILRPIDGGIPLGRDLEIYSRLPETGKSSIALAILKSFQLQGLRTAYVDAECTLTEQYLNQLGILTRDGPERPGIIPVLIVRSQEEVIPAETILNAVRALSKMVDLVVVDSIAALEKEDNLAKDDGDPNQMGGIAKLLGESIRKNLAKRAAVIWLNQSRQTMGGMPGMGPQYVTPGGKAVGFFSSVRLELSQVERLKIGKDDDPYGIAVKVFTAKNKIAPQFKSVTLKYIFGDGFSSIDDYIQAGLKAGVIEKSGSWYSMQGERLGQGYLNTYKVFKDDPARFEQLKRLIDGEDVTDDAVDPVAAPEG